MKAFFIIILLLVIAGYIYKAYTNSYFYRNGFLNAVRLEMLPYLNSGLRNGKLAVNSLYEWVEVAKKDPELMRNKVLKEWIHSLEKNKNVYTSFERYSTSSTAWNFEYHYNVFRRFVEELNYNAQYISNVFPNHVSEHLMNAHRFLYNSDMLAAIKSLNSRVYKFNKVAHENNLINELKEIELS